MGSTGEPSAKRGRMEETNNKGPHDTTNSAIDAGPDIQYPTGKHIKVFEYAGSTWLNNLVGGTPDAGAWTQFPWEYMQLFLNTQQRNEVAHHYQKWKPISVHFEITNPDAIMEINTGATPTIIPQPNAKLYGTIDYGYTQPLDSIVSSTLTFGNFSNILTSWDNGGYTANAVTYMPNQTIAANTMTIRENIAAQKIIPCQNGQKMEFEWKYHNRYWRSTSEFVAGALFTSSGTTIVGVRTDELYGVVTGSSSGATGLPAIPYQFGLAQPSYTTWQALPAPVTAQRFQIWTDHDPQPPLMIHLQPQFGAFGSSGPISCQIDFKIKYVIECSGEIPTDINRLAGTPITGASNPPLPTMGTNFPFFLPIANPN